MADTFCVKHGGKPAVGYCSKCNKPYCEECLDMETGKPVCLDCLKAKAVPAAAPTAAPPPSAPNPLGGSPLNFKGKGMEDDPLGLFGAGGPKVEAPKLTPTPPPFKPPTLPPPKPAASPASAPMTPPISKPPLPLSLDQLGMAPISMDQIKEPPPLRPPFPQGGPSAPMPSSTPRSIPSTPLGDLGMPKKNNPASLLLDRAQKANDRLHLLMHPLAAKLRLPTVIVVAAAVVLVVGSVIGISLSMNQTAIPLVDSIQPIHFVQVNAGQVAEMDVTAYAEVQNQVQSMGFQPVIQMTVPQLPSNFFDVGMKQDAGAYSEIIKMAGQLTPHLSFVTVFTNGVWFSTNAWQGTNQNLDYLVSEFYPNDTPDQLWVQHMQTLAKLKQDKGWEIQSLGENRYLGAFSDHLRWFLDKKGIPAYQADFNLWH